MAIVRLQGNLRQIAGGRETLEADGASVRAVVEALDCQYPGLVSAIIKDDVALRPGIAVAVDGNVVKKGLLHPVGPDSEINFFPAIGGG